MVRIGIPRALLYYYFAPGWKEFLERLGAEIVVSPPTNRFILDRGIKISEDELCLPCKVFFGHMDWLLGRADYIFLPRYLTLGKGENVCPKLMGLPDMCRAIFSPDLPLFEPRIDRWGRYYREFFWGGLEKVFTTSRLNRAWQHAQKRQKRVEEKKEIKNKKAPLLVVLGHTYLVEDNYLNLGILEKIKNLGYNPLTSGEIPRREREKGSRWGKRLFWPLNRRELGVAYLTLRGKYPQIRGIINLSSFACGPDSISAELITRRTGDSLPLLNLVFDEHTGSEGLSTRLEAFIDLLEGGAGCG